MLRVEIRVAAGAVRLGKRQAALDILDLIEERADGCGSTPERNDWITDCDAQVGFRELLALYRRNVASMQLPR